MSDVKWIRIVTDIFDNRKIRQIESLPNGDSIIVIWLKILTLAGNINDSGLVYFTKEIPYTDQLLATAFNRPLATVQFALDIFQKFSMIEIVNDVILISNWEKYQSVEGLDKIREQNRIRKQRQRDRQKALQESCHVTVTGRHATDIDIEEEQEGEREEYMSVSNETDCSTDVQRILEAWNAIDGIPKVQKLSPKSKRGKSLGARIKEYGVDRVLEAIAEIPKSAFLMGRTGKFKITFDWFVLPNNFPKVLEGNYADRPKRTFEKTDIAYRAARKLGRLVSERAGVPEPKEETLQTWAGELADCVEENQTSFEDFADVMAFSQENSFWRKTVLDAASLRKHYVKLMAEMNDGGRE